MENQNNPNGKSQDQESSFKNIMGYDSEQTSVNADAKNPGSFQNAEESSPSEQNAGFAKPQADDWPDEDESKDHPGGPTKNRE
ncbi:MAG: hypothetical protein EOO50_05745 [Flavobacterium sp.]|uniref:hypothetical protein n=1 Tax=Flavobacterium sp. TaxID=239 RepID=UPI001229193A|nr:hypothetical protein [Flavobacterium sp.]RZJ67488.1 MAG: hypothetical protein EOO50_05745 [Flavobacterium sp.]